MSLCSPYSGRLLKLTGWDACFYFLQLSITNTNITFYFHTYSLLTITIIMMTGQRQPSLLVQYTTNTGRQSFLLLSNNNRPILLGSVGYESRSRSGQFIPCFQSGALASFNQCFLKVVRCLDQINTQLSGLLS